MKIEEYKDSGNVVLYIEGDMDGSGNPELEKRLEKCFSEESVENIFLDMEKVSYISSLGIRSLMVAHKKGIKTKKKISLVNITSKAMTVMKAVGILPLFEKSENDE